MKDINSGAQNLDNSSCQLSTTSTQMRASADQTNQKGATVAAAAEEMSTNNMNSIAAAAEEAASNVNIVAAAAEEMISTINEIASNTGKTSEMSPNAFKRAQDTSVKVNKLGDAALEIGKVTETIT